MRHFFRRPYPHPALALGNAMLWGLLEFMALHSARRTKKISAAHPKPPRTDSADITRARQ